MIFSLTLLHPSTHDCNSHDPVTTRNWIKLYASKSISKRFSFLLKRIQIETISTLAIIVYQPRVFPPYVSSVANKQESLLRVRQYLSLSIKLCHPRNNTSRYGVNSDSPRFCSEVSNLSYSHTVLFLDFSYNVVKFTFLYQINLGWLYCYYYFISEVISDLCVIKILSMLFILYYLVSALRLDRKGKLIILVTWVTSSRYFSLKPDSNYSKSAWKIEI